MLGQQSLDGDLGLFYLRRIVLILNREANLRFLKTVEHIAGGNRTQADIVNLADGRLFLDLDDQSPSLRRLLAGEANVLEIAGIPQGVKVALQTRWVINIAGVGEDAGFDGFSG